MNIDDNVMDGSARLRIKGYVSCAICIPIRLSIAVSTALYMSVSFVSIDTIRE